MTLTRLQLNRPLESENSFVFALRLQGSKRTIRSNDIFIQRDKSDHNIDIQFTVQYPHFVKRKTNCMLLMLQRRKKYKNRPIPGFKTLAVGSIDMTEVMQCWKEQEMTLNCNNEAMGKVFLSTLSTQPSEAEEKQREMDGVDSEDEEDASSPEEETDSDPALLDELHLEGAGGGGGSNAARNRFLKLSARGRRQRSFVSDRQMKIKQRITDLFKKIRIQEEELGLGNATVRSAQHDIQSLIDDLEDFSDDSEAEAFEDSISIISTPKPQLRPYWGDSKNSIQTSREALPTIATYDNGISEESKDSESQEHDNTDNDLSDTALNCASSVQFNLPPSGRYTLSGFNGEISGHPSPDPTLTGSICSFGQDSRSKPIARTTGSDSLEPISGKQATPVSPAVTVSRTDSQLQQKLLQIPLISDQLTNRMSSDAGSVPPKMFLISADDTVAQHMVQSVLNSEAQTESPYLLVSSIADIRAVLGNLASRIQRFCNTNNVAPSTSKVCLVVNDRLLSFCLRIYTEIFGAKNSDWLQYIKFYVTSPGSSSFTRFLSGIDPNYSSLFPDGGCLQERPDVPLDINEAVKRVNQYIDTAPIVFSLPISEVMLQCKEKSGERENAQQFVPFILDVRIGAMDSSGVEPADVASPTTPRDPNIPGCSPPASPYVSAIHSNQGSPEVVDLQIEYWTTSGSPAAPQQVAGVGLSGGGKCDLQQPLQKKDSGSVKYTLKTAFRSMVITRNANVDVPTLSLAFTKEKKQQKMFHKLGMKSREKVELEPKSQVVKNITRFICSAKQHELMKVIIDGVEWSNVKFFQVSAQWPTHVKVFPVGSWQMDSSYALASAAT